ncbi:type II toxin-antitoxin system VapC family toxin [Myxosarcina sp. GI1]|uniref:type II toxin-antitoxin system VapC family toxin n=1 Tax=Myxosarcina sp. GI1 TaxID=1541065 RepID=UPI00055F673B|nr:type II toxin-antitoxin system VapC family toxin [Myxosarcina sp. GI1]
MTLRYLLDTNVVSEPVRPKPNPAVLAKLQAHQEEIGTAVVVWHELLFGCQRLLPSKKRRKIETYLQKVVQPHIPLLPYDETAATWHAKERTRLVAAGKTPAFVDGQIAAIAYTNNLILVTNNTSDFQNFLNLKLENWHQ